MLRLEKVTMNVCMYLDRSEVINNWISIRVEQASEPINNIVEKHFNQNKSVSNISNISWYYFSSCLSEMVFVARKFVQRTASLHGGVVRLPFT